MAKRIGILYFSPTSTTKKICLSIASGMGENNPQITEMTLPEIRTEIISDPNIVTENIDHLIVASPVHSGKLPVQVKECLNALKGNEKDCSIVVVYGNRNYGTALYNMAEIFCANDFNIRAAGAFIGQHSYSDIIPIALERPDKSDIEKALRFGKHSLRSTKNLSLKDIPIQIDNISKSKKYTAIKPVYNLKACLQCGICARKCPVGILSPITGTYINNSAKKQCIGCMSCVKNCLQKARVAKVNLIIKTIMNSMLKQALKERKEPLTIIK